MKNKFIYLILSAMFSFLLFLGTPQVYGDSLGGDIDPSDGFTTSNNTYYSESVPEPQTMFLLGAGLILLAAFGRKKIRKG